VDIVEDVGDALYLLGNLFQIGDILEMPFLEGKHSGASLLMQERLNIPCPWAIL